MVQVADFSINRQHYDLLFVSLTRYFARDEKKQTGRTSHQTPLSSQENSTWFRH
jgi:hypothetical protein